MAAEQQQKQIFRVVEFYSGIGGMHYALKACGIPAQVVAAIDINTTANEVYSYNFPDTTLLNRNIEGIKLDAFIKLDADVFVMSPPCQPFTRQGHQKASSDARTKSFLHIMKMIERLPKAPSYILMENVKGFEVSDTREEFIRTLGEANYVYQEFLLTPTQFGIPNSRLRYFLIAVQEPLKFPFQVAESIMKCLPVGPYPDTSIGRPCFNQKIDIPRTYCTTCSKTKDHSTIQSTSQKPQKCFVASENKELLGIPPCTQTPYSNSPSNYCNSSSPSSAEHTEISMGKYTDLGYCNEHCLDSVVEDEVKQYKQNVRNIVDFLELDKNNFKEFLLPENILRRKVLLMDIVQEGCNHSCCFTKGYGHYVEGTGSVLQMASGDPSDIFCQYGKVNEEDRFQHLAPLGLRYFTPREISNIHCFPKDFDFPQTTSTKQKYRLLGNSLNVLVLSELMKLLLESKKP